MIFQIKLKNPHRRSLFLLLAVYRGATIKQYISGGNTIIFKIEKNTLQIPEADFITMKFMSQSYKELDDAGWAFLDVVNVLEGI